MLGAPEHFARFSIFFYLILRMESNLGEVVAVIVQRVEGKLRVGGEGSVKRGHWHGPFLCFFYKQKTLVRSPPQIPCSSPKRTPPKNEFPPHIMSVFGIHANLQGSVVVERHPSRATEWLRS